MSHTLNADLHCHSVVSDGTLTPEELAARAKTNGVELWSLTDHDEVGGQDRAITAAGSQGLKYLTGAEVSVTFAGVTVHIVGLGFDHHNEALVKGLRSTRGGRGPRAMEMAADLEKVGIPNAYEGALKYVDNPELISRTHFARYIVEAGFCKDTNEVFRKYLADGKPGFVPHRWAKLSDALSWICGAGGLPVIAHPGRYAFTANEEFALFTEFKAYGGVGVEVLTGAHNPSDVVKYLGFCEEFDLYASRGSDFHSPDESHCDLGSLPDLPGSVTPIWEPLADKII